MSIAPATRILTTRHRLVTASTPLLLFPRFLLFLAESNGAERRTTLTALESFLALHTGILLVAMAIALVLNVSVRSNS